MNKEGKRYRFRNQLYWACNGRIFIEDQDTGDFKSKSRREMLERADSFNQSISHCHWADEREELHRTVHDLIDCIKEAREQGDPHEPGVIAQVGRESRKSSWWTGEAAWQQANGGHPLPDPNRWEFNKPKWITDGNTGAVMFVPAHDPSELFKSLQL